MLEILGVIGLLIAINIGYRLLFVGARVATAGVKAAVTGQSIDEALGRMANFETKIVTKNTEPDASGLDFYAIEMRGLFPIQTSRELAFVVSLFDASDGDEKMRPVLSLIEQFQEQETTAYNVTAQIGRVEPNQGFIKWVEVGRILPLFVQSPFSGIRNLKVVCRLVDADAVQDIRLGYSSVDDHNLYWFGTHDLELDQVAKGYEEAFEERKECLSLSVQLGMSVAMADGSLDDAEGQVIKAWVRKAITPFSDDNQKELKNLLNATMKEAYVKLQNSEFSKSDVVNRFNEIGDEAKKLEAMELCYEVMAADGVADPEEIKVLHRLGETLDLDIKELEKIRDLKMMNLSSEIGTDDASLLGIDPEWSDDQIQKHLRSEFRKWNGRLNDLPQGEARDHAQKMLDLIGKERSKYG